MAVTTTSSTIVLVISSNTKITKQLNCIIIPTYNKRYYLVRRLQEFINIIHPGYRLRRYIHRFCSAFVVKKWKFSTLYKNQRFLRAVSRKIKTRATLFIFRDDSSNFEKPAAKTLVSGLFSGFCSNEYEIFGAIWIQSKILFPPTKWGIFSLLIATLQ